MAFKRFKLRNDAASEVEKFSKMKNKLETFIEKHEENAGSFSKYLLESKVLESDNLDPSEVRELMEVSKNVRLDWEEQSEKLAKSNLREIEVLTEIHVENCQAKIEKVLDGSNECIKNWTVEIQPDKNNFPNVLVRQEFTSLENPATGGMPEITRLEVDIEGMDVDTDLDEGLKYCENNLEPQLLTRLMQEYLPLNQERQDMYKTTSKYCNLRSGNMIEFTNSMGSVLANICFLIQFNKRSLSWVCSWMCKLTDSGTIACSSLHLPSELARTGTVTTWDWARAMDTLSKVARLDAETPAKTGAGVCDFSSLDTDTPARGEETRKKMTKRKLN